MSIKFGRLFSLSIALIIALSAFIPMVGVGTLSSSDQYVPMPPGDFYVVKDDHGGNNTGFDIYYDTTRISDVSDVAIAANIAYDNVTAFFGSYDHRTRIILASNHDQYRDILRDDTVADSEVAGAWGDGDRSTIVIESPEQLSDFKPMLAEEFTRIVLRDRLIDNKYNVPAWFEDGLSTYVAGNISDNARSNIEDMCRQNKLMTVSQIENILDHSTDGSVSQDDVDMAHAQSAMLLEYIINKYGKDDVKLIITDYGPTGDLDNAFMKSIGYTPEDMNAEWKVSLKNDLSVKDGLVLSQRVYGYVHDSDGKPVANETVLFTSMRNDSTVFGKPYTATTNNAGYYQINMTYGPFTAHVDKQGYVPADDNISLNKSEVRLYNFTLAKQALPAPSDTIVPNGTTDNTTMYIVLAIVNIAALLLIGFVFWRTRK